MRLERIKKHHQSRYEHLAHMCNMDRIYGGRDNAIKVEHRKLWFLGMGIQILQERAKK